MNETLIKKTLEIMAEEAVPVDLAGWAKIQTRLATKPPFNMSKRHSSIYGENLMDPRMARQKKLRLVFTPILITFIALAGILATPQGRAWAQSLLRFFTRIESNTIPIPTQAPLIWVTQTPGVIAATPTIRSKEAFSAVCGDLSSLRCSIAQIRGMVNFPIKELGVIPDLIHFVGASGGPEWVMIVYDSQAHNGGITLTQERWTGSASQIGWKIASSAKVDTVTIGNQTGEYVNGIFVAGEDQHQLTWDDKHFGVQTLRWVDDNVLITLEIGGLIGQINKDDMVKLAESLTTQPVSTLPTPDLNITPTPPTMTPMLGPENKFEMTIALASEKAGFNIQAPTYLPRNLVFNGASYDPTTDVAGLWYYFKDGYNPYGTDLRIREEQITDPSTCILCAFKPILPTFNPGVTAEVNSDRYGSIVARYYLMPIQIGDITGQYAEGMWDNAWTWMPDSSVKRMRWESNGFAYEFYSTNPEFTKDDLITLAKSMK